MGSGIVFSVGGLSSEQDLQRLRREEEMGEDKERKGRRFNNIHKCHHDIFQPLVHTFSSCFPFTVVCMNKGLTGFQWKSHVLPSTVSTQHTRSPALKCY